MHIIKNHKTSLPEWTRYISSWNDKSFHFYALHLIQSTYFSTRWLRQVGRQTDLSLTDSWLAWCHCKLLWDMDSKWCHILTVKFYKWGSTTLYWFFNKALIMLFLIWNNQFCSYCLEKWCDRILDGGQDRVPFFYCFVPFYLVAGLVFNFSVYMRVQLLEGRKVRLIRFYMDPPVTLNLRGCRGRERERYCKGFGR